MDGKIIDPRILRTRNLIMEAFIELSIVADCVIRWQTALVFIACTIQGNQFRPILSKSAVARKNAQKLLYGSSFS